MERGSLLMASLDHPSPDSPSSPQAAATSAGPTSSWPSVACRAWTGARPTS